MTEREKMIAALDASSPVKFRGAVVREARELTAGPGEYARLGKSVGELVARKRSAYGDSFAKSAEILRVLYPDGVPLDAVADVLFVARVLDKLCRIAASAGKPDPMGEDPAQDIAGYALLRMRGVR